MGSDLIASVTSIATAIVGVAIIAVLVSKKAATGQVISAAGSAFGYDLGVAVGPVTGFQPSPISSIGNFGQGF